MPANLSQLPLFTPPEGELPSQAASKPIITLPFQRADEITTERARRILGVSLGTLHRMVHKHLLRAYRMEGSGRGFAFWRIEYQDVVGYCDRLRVEHGISPRSVGAVGIRGRRRDADLLPFPLDETVSIADVAERLGSGRESVLHLVQSGGLVAYQVLFGQRGCPWRIHAASVDKYLLSLNRAAERKPTPTSRGR